MAGLYLHIPYCSQRCIYCDFYFVTTKRVHTSFIHAMKAELALYAHEYATLEPIESIYFGGGTPSRLHAEEVEELMACIRDLYDISALQEVTFEMNPEDVSPSYLRSIAAAGVDRISLGVQSFFDSDLQFLSRVHDAARAREAIEMIQDSSIRNLSVDLIFAIPDQDMEYWAANLEIACDYDISHISTYGLTIEEKTVLHKQVENGQVVPVTDDDHAQRFLFTMDFMRDRGYEHYEISSFARPGARSIHNHRYWSHTNYIGCGPSAHSFWWKGLPARRWENVRNLKSYEALLSGRSRPIDAQESLSLDVLAREYIMLRLRTSDGLDLAILEDRYGVDLLTDKVDELAALEEASYIEPIRNQVVTLTDSGKTICNSIIERLLP